MAAYTIPKGLQSDPGNLSHVTNVKNPNFDAIVASLVGAASKEMKIALTSGRQSLRVAIPWLKIN
jgi:hypothetical protein